MRSTARRRLALNALERVETMLGEEGITSMLDAGCGSYGWLQHWLEAHPRTAYVGCDLTPEPICSNAVSWFGFAESNFWDLPMGVQDPDDESTEDRRREISFPKGPEIGAGAHH